MKRLPPSIQEKQRYLRFRIHSDEEVELGDIVDAIWDASLRYLGSKGSSEADFWVIGNKFDPSEQEGILRVNLDAEADLRAALTLVDEIAGQDALLEVTGTSGTMESLEKN